jgi:hypothetical protein
MCASLKTRWRKLSISLWLAAVIASFISYFDPSMRVTDTRGTWLGLVFQLVAFVLCFFAAFCWGRYEGWFEGRRIFAILRGSILVTLVSFFYWAVALAGGMLLHVWH